MISEQEYLKLLDLLYRVVEANRGQPIGDDRLLDAEGVATKFFLHATSALYLARETRVPDFPGGALQFVDPGSVSVLARATLEAFLAFHYVFAEPTTDEERRYRYCAWKIAGLMKRQGFPAREKFVDPRSNSGQFGIC